MSRPKASKFDEPIPYDISELGEIWLHQQRRICATCGDVAFLKGYVWGDEVYCHEHEPLHFMADFRRLEAIFKSTGGEPEYPCYWTIFQTVAEVDGKLVLLYELG